MKYVKLIASVALLAVILCAFYDYVTNKRLSIIGFDVESRANRQPIPWSDLILAGTGMLLGIVFGVAYEALWRTRENDQSAWATIVAAATSRDTIRAIIVAPIIFSGVYLAAQKEPDKVLAALFAFQNGFFCEKIFRSKQEG